MNKELVNKINQNWFSVTIISILVFGILMLFFKELSNSFRDYLIPSFIIYILGTAIIGQIQGSNFRNNFGKQDNEPVYIYTILHIIWFIAFIVYLYLRNVI